MEEDRNLRTDVRIKKTEIYNEKNFWRINREMLPYKLHFFLFVGGAGAILPFLAAFGITVLGLTATNIAACFTAYQVSVLIFKPGIGYLADYLNRLKALFIGLTVIRATVSLLMILIPNTGMPGIPSMQFTTNFQNNTYCHLCFNSNSFEHLNPKRFLDKEILGEISFCFNNSNTAEITAMKCSPVNSTNYNKDQFDVWQAKCNLSNTDSVSLEKYVSFKHSELTTQSIDVLYMKTSQIDLICLFPNNKSPYYRSITSLDLNQYCYSLLNKSDTILYSSSKSNFTTTKCKTLHFEISNQADGQRISAANYNTYQFYLYAICLVIVCTCVSVEFTMSDTICYENVQGADYGQQRVWGAISWGFIAPLAGYLIDYTEGYIATWLLFAGITVLQIWNLSGMNIVKPDFSMNILKDVKKIFSSMDFLCFEFGVFMNGFFTGIIWYHIPWFIISIGGNKLIIGLVHTIECFGGNTPAMYFSGWLIKKLGHFNLVSLSLICYALRFFLYSYLHNPWWMLPIECLHGFTYGSFYSAMTSYAKLHSKPGTEATTQSILCTTYDALGAGVGCLLIGVCLEYFGGHITFFYVSILCVISTTLNVLSTLIIGYRKNLQDKPKSSTCVELN